MKSQPIVELTASIQARRASEGWFRPLACASGLYFHQPTLEHGWSRAILTVQIESDLYGRQGKAISNFTETLPSPQSDLVQQTLKDPYIFDFLTLHAEAIERDLKSSLVDSQMGHPDDAPSIGLVLCKTRDRITAEYALRDIAKPIGVAQWQTKLGDSLPEPLKSSLPSIEEIEAEFELHQTGSFDDASTTHSATNSRP